MCQSVEVWIKVNAKRDSNPGFTSFMQLKTATLTLVLVALLIVALSSVDSALSFILALLLRRTP